MNPVAQVLRAAADRIERDGWCQGGAGRDGERRCAWRALNDEWCAIRADDRPPWERIDVAVRARVPQCLVHWNDTPGRTVDEVLAALRGAAADAEGK